MTRSRGWMKWTGAILAPLVVVLAAVGQAWPQQGAGTVADPGAKATPETSAPPSSQDPPTVEGAPIGKTGATPAGSGAAEAGPSTARPEASTRPTPPAVVQTVKAPRNNCRGLDTASDPRCSPTSGRPFADGEPSAGGGRESGAPAPIAPLGTKPRTARPPLLNPPPPAGAPTKTSRSPLPSSGPLTSHRNLLIGVVLALASTAGLGWLLLGRQPFAPRRMKSDPPTPHRRDLVLLDARGRKWRVAGADLTPGLILGRDPRRPDFLEIEDLERHHAELWVQEGRLLVRPLGGNALFLNDRLLSREATEILSTGDRLRLRRTELTVIID